MSFIVITSTVLDVGFVQFIPSIMTEIIWRGEDTLFCKVTKKKYLKVKTPLFGNVTDNDCIKKVNNLFVMYHKGILNLTIAFWAAVVLTLVQFLKKIKIYS